MQVGNRYRVTVDVISDDMQFLEYCDGPDSAYVDLPAGAVFRVDSVELVPCPLPSHDRAFGVVESTGQELLTSRGDLVDLLTDGALVELTGD